MTQVTATLGISMQLKTNKHKQTLNLVLCLLCAKLQLETIFTLCLQEHWESVESFPTVKMYLI